MHTVDLDGKPVQQGMKPVGEVIIHCSIDKASPVIKSVIHVHPFWATTLSIAGKQILPVGTSFGHYFPDGVPMLDNGFGWLVIEEHGEQIVQAMGPGMSWCIRGTG